MRQLVQVLGGIVPARRLTGFVHGIVAQVVLGPERCECPLKAANNVARLSLFRVNSLST